MKEKGQDLPPTFQKGLNDFERVRGPAAYDKINILSMGFKTQLIIAIFNRPH